MNAIRVFILTCLWLGILSGFGPFPASSDALTGEVSDDGLPTGSSLRVQWSKCEGPGTVSFANTNSAATAVTFSANGLYVLKLQADDGEALSSDLMEARVGIACSVSDPAGLAAWWPGNGTAIDKVTCVAGVLGSGTGFAAGKVASAFNLDGANDFVWMSARTNYDMGPGASGFTVEFWIKPGNFANSSVLGWANGVRAERVLANSPGGKLRFQLAGSGTTFIDTTEIWGTLALAHVALTSDRTTGQARTYVNGALTSTATVGTSLLSTAGDFYLGQVPGSTGFFNGQLDEVSLYTRPLPLAEVQAIFNAGSSGKCLTPANQPPTVLAGADRTITFPLDTVTLHGTVFDDGLPSNTLTVAWIYLTGPSAVFFTSTNTPVTTVAFTNTGVYTFQLSASDGQFATNDTATVTVLPDPRTPPGIALTSPANGVPVEIPSGGSTNLTVTASVSDADGQVVLVEFFLNGASLGTRNTAPYSLVASNLTAATHTFTAVATDNDGLSNTSAPVSVVVFVDSGPPTVAITAPEDATVVTAPTNIVGTASSPLLQSYQVRYRLAVSEDFTPAPWVTLATCAASVVNGTLAVFDPTLLLNGIYEVQLTATDSRARTSSSEILTLLVDRAMKIGHFTMSFSDLNVPLAGVPIEIVRSYDSRDKRTNDFGVGWSLDIRNVRLQKTRNLGANWNATFSTPFYSLDSIKPRRISITLAGDKSYQFESVLTPSQQFGLPIESTRMTFTNLPATYGTLQIDGDNLASLDGFTGFVNLIDIGDFSYFNPTRFKFTTAEGDVYTIDEKEGLKSLEDRHHNTLTITTNGVFHSSGISVAFTRDTHGRITVITDPMGGVLHYAYGTNGSLAAFTDRTTNTTAFAYTNVAFPNYLTEITDPRGVKAVRSEFDAEGRMVRQIDGNGNAVEFTHDLANNREVVRDRLGNVTVHEYDERGNVVRTTDPLGRQTLYSFDALENQLTKIDALTNITICTYDTRANKLTETDPLGNITFWTYNAFNQITSIRDPLGFVTTNRYDPDGNLIEERNPLGHATSYTHDSQGNILTRTDALGQLTESQYNAQGRLTNIVVHGAQGQVLASTGFAYDGNGNLRGMLTPRTGDNGLQLLSTQFTYDANNRLATLQFADGATIRRNYDSLGRISGLVDALGRVTSFAYDGHGNRTNATFADGTFETAAYDAEQRRVMTTDRAGRATQFNYDPLGRLIRTVFADSSTTTNVYDAIGRLVAFVDERGNTTGYEYEEHCGCSGRNTAIVDALGRITRYGYDANGNQTNVVDALGNTTRFVYDGNDRHVQTIRADDTSEEFFYDGLDRLIAQTDADGFNTWFGYDGRDRLTSVTNHLGGLTRYEYDELGKLLSQTDANGHATSYAYDLAGRRSRRTLPGGQVERYAYDSAGSLTHHTNFNGRVTTFQYDAMNRLLHRVPDAVLNEPTVSFTYSATGRRLSMTDASGLTTYAYNLRKWLTQKITPQGALAYTYEAGGNVTRIQSSNPNGADVHYDYDPLDRLNTVNDTHVGVSALAYDQAGNLTRVAQPNGIVVTNVVDRMNRVTSMASLGAQNGLMRQFDYTHSASGRRVSVQEPGRRTVNYAYDALHRLTQEAVTGTQGTLNVNYTYDTVGNRLSRGSQTHTYDANDRISGATYDANGNTISGVLPHPVTGQPTAVADQFDAEDRLKDRNSGQVSMVYDGDGNRVRKTVNGVTTFYLVDDLNPTGYAQVLEELSVVNGQLSVSRVYAYDYALNSQDQLLDDGQGSLAWSASFHGYDDHGSVRYLTDLAGNVTDTYDYDAFGNLIQQSGSTPNNYLYAGEQFDQDLGLYYFRARYFNSNTGRFWTRDPFEGFADDPSSLNGYLYANADPVNNWDPSGYDTLAEVMHSSWISAKLNIARLNARLRPGGAKGSTCGLVKGFNQAGAALQIVENAALVGKALGTIAGVGLSAAIGVGTKALADDFGNYLIETFNLVGLEQLEAFTYEANADSGMDIYRVGETPKRPWGHISQFHN